MKNTLRDIIALCDWFSEDSAPLPETEFLGDLYQHFCEDARKGRALVQTPDFVREFLLERTITKAIDAYGLARANMIDPSCGCGHLLVDGFRLIHARMWDAGPDAVNADLASRGEMAISKSESFDEAITQLALDRVVGTDLDPACVAIARMRLQMEAWEASGVRKRFRVSVHCGDSLMCHRPREGDNLTRDTHHVRDALQAGQYAAVVGNPPYIVCKDSATSDKYRARYTTCHRKYSLALPFTEMMFSLASPGGFVGMLTANSFMKREFGKKFIEEYVPTIDLTHVIDTSGAYIPGHGTPTVILFGRNQPPVDAKILAVMGIKGEPTTPADPRYGLVWQSIVKGTREAEARKPGLFAASPEVDDVVSVACLDRGGLLAQGMLFADDMAA